MKLSNVLLLIVFLCVIFFVSDISANYAEDGPYKASASAYRTGGIYNNRLHVHLFASAQCTDPFARDGSYKLKFYRITAAAPFPGETIFEKTQADNPNLVLDEFGQVDGEFYDSKYLPLFGEKHQCLVEADSDGETSAGVSHSASTFAVVGPMPDPPREFPPQPNPELEPEPQLGIFPIDPTDTPSPGETHGYVLYTADPYYWVDWYVKAPWHTSERGEYIEGDSGDGTTTEATMSYTYPSGAMHTGDFLITAVIYRWSDQSQYEETYTATVSLE
ncbi:MAG: hypothetical protein OXI43_17480 [Candidatus Poribacteria bacterium]|nr:hypothetical protein [Candidatus Poribacteria bacterium]